MPDRISSGPGAGILKPLTGMIAEANRVAHPAPPPTRSRQSGSGRVTVSDPGEIRDLLQDFSEQTGAQFGG